MIFATRNSGRSGRSLGPPPCWAEEFNGIDLVVMDLQFDQAAKKTFYPDLAQNLANAGAKFMEASLSRMQ